MRRVQIITVILGLFVYSCAALALTNSSDSGSGALETVSPTLQSVSATTERSLSVTFSEPLLTPGDTTAVNYGLAGLGAGTLEPVPSTVMGNDPYTLSWATGEMLADSTVELTVSGLQDVVGNLINPAQDRASASSIGVLPVFSDLSVNPAKASTGQTVTITFTASEALDGEPVVSVNGHEATWTASGKNIGFTYTHVVQDTDPIGLATLSVTGFDLAGNLGSLTDKTLLEIVEEEAGLPMSVWPLALALLIAGVLLIVWRRNRAGALALLVLAALIASSSAFAAAPTVSHVTFSQSPDGTAGTKVDIYYDLVAPNSPCAITLSLSKDDGADGFIHPMTHYTGDIANVTTGIGKHIVWDIRANYPEETIPNAKIRVAADDGIIQHTLTYAAGTHGSITGTSPQTVNHGADAATVTAVADLGYHFVQWSDGSTDNPRTDTAVTADVSATATFAINTYTLTYTAGAHGSITGISPQTVDYGLDGTVVEAVPDSDYHFVQWSDGLTVNPRTDTDVVANKSVTATFAINTYTLTIGAPQGQGTVSPAAGTYTYDAGTSVALTVSSPFGWRFSHWTGDVTGSANPATVIMTANKTATPVFVRTYTLTYTAGANGFISGTALQTVNSGSDGSTVSALPDIGYHFVQWSDASTQNPRTDTNVTANLSVMAVFAINTYTLRYTAGANGSITGTSPQTVNYGANGTAVTAVADTAYHFVQWSDGNTDNPRTDTSVASNKNVTATFAINTYTLTYTAGANGSINGTSPQTVNSGADSTAVTAVADTDYHFLQWSDGRTDNPRTDVGVVANKSVSALFVVNTFTLTYTAGANGSISGTSPQTVNYGANGTAVTAVADGGYHFVQWSDGRTDNPRTDVGVIGNVTVTATFAQDTSIPVPEMISVAAGTFTMGNSGVGDDATYSSLYPQELPTHSVTLGAYQIGKYHVTIKQYCDVLNWALAQGYLYADAAGTVWSGTGNIYAGGTATSRYLIVSFASTDCSIQYAGGVFSSKMSPGLPSGTNYSMDMHPVEDVSWYGSVAFCNWLSQMQGLTVCYDMVAANWPLTVAPPASGGYRLPTEAEWERAAAWDGSKHWIYGFTSDALTGKSQANFLDSNPNYVNPLGLTTYPYTSPVGWFNGVNVNPNGGVTTANSVSPVGAYDMCGNVWNWCGDWYLSTYYSGGAMTNPTGPANGSARVLRGGSWSSSMQLSRSACRGFFSPPTITGSAIGFRLARSTPSVGVSSFTIDNGDASTTSQTVTLNNTCTGNPTEYMASESATFSGATWQTYAVAPSFTLSAGIGTKTVYFKAKNAVGESVVVSDTIELIDSGGHIAGEQATFAGIAFRWCPAGTFMMGALETEQDSQSWEKPQHQVTLSKGFWLSETEVTQAQWLAVMGSNPSYFKPPSYSEDNSRPVEQVSWNDICTPTTGYLAKLNAANPGNGFRLPTEAEWEYAYRAGTTQRFYWGDDPSYTQIGNYAWYSGNNTPNGTKPVGTKTANAWGLKDMSGNVYEWCSDWWGSYASGVVTDPTGPGTGSSRVVRGGSWYIYGNYCRAAFRNYAYPGSATYDVGFRLALSGPSVTSFTINNGDASTTSQSVTLNNTCTGNPTEYMASESATFSGATWQTYAVAPSFTLSAGISTKTVYFKVKNAAGESAGMSDAITLSSTDGSYAGEQATFAGIEFRWCPAGTFMMGALETEQDSQSNEKPQHQVTLSKGFWLSETEVTQAQWVMIMGNNPSHFTGDTSRPVEKVSWNDICAATTGYLAKLNTANPGNGFRLPTEAEWEYAYRAGTTQRFYWGDDPGYTLIGNYAWYSENNTPNGTKAVGQKTANSWGLKDMSGNVWEWCSDWYGNYTSGAVTDPTGPGTGSSRVQRGGSWLTGDADCRAAFRASTYPGDVWFPYGFRLAR